MEGKIVLNIISSATYSSSPKLQILPDALTEKCMNEETQVPVERESYEEEEGTTNPSEAEIEQQSSPRGVLEVTISGSGSDSDNGIIDPSIEKLAQFPVGRPLTAAELSLNYGNLQWKKMFGQVKKTSTAWRFSTMSMIMGYGQDVPKKKSWKKKLGLNRVSEEDVIGDVDFIMPKPSWRSFTYEELKQATDDFSPGILLILFYFLHSFLALVNNLYLNF